MLEPLVKPLHWIVAGAVTGGEKRKSEKVRDPPFAACFFCTEYELPHSYNIFSRPVHLM